MMPQLGEKEQRRKWPTDVTKMARFLMAINSPDIAMSGSDLFVTDQTSNTIDEYTTSGVPELAPGPGVEYSMGHCRDATHPRTFHPRSSRGRCVQPCRLFMATEATDGIAHCQANAVGHSSGRPIFIWRLNGEAAPPSCLAG